MPERDEIVFRQQGRGQYTMEFGYNEDFIAYIKRRVPRQHRSYDEDTHIWTFWDYDGKTLNALEGVAAQKFHFVIRWYRNADDKLVMRNIKTGTEVVQEELFR